MRQTRTLGNPALWAALALATVTVVLQAQTPAQPAFRAGTDLIVVPVVVVDGSGADVTTLTRGDFAVFEDGRPMAVETFVAPGATDAETGRYVVGYRAPIDGHRAHAISVRVQAPGATVRARRIRG